MNVKSYSHPNSNHFFAFLNALCSTLSARHSDNFQNVEVINSISRGMRVPHTTFTHLHTLQANNNNNNNTKLN